jgi:pimeloyl-ACP methyl ester carboxylesterase
VTSYFFGPEEAPLFAMYTPPRAQVARNAGILLCPPIGLEYFRTHYAIRQLAKQLSAAGFHILRFDYHGTGDSGGEIGFGQFETWVDDIALALNELVDISGAESISIVGLRMGAVLAIEALARRNFKVNDLVLWDPVVAGRQYLATLEEMQAQLVALRHAPPQPTDELLGAHFPVDLRAAIDGLDIGERLDKLDAKSATLILSEEQPEYGALLDAMRNRWPTSAHRTMNESLEWANVKAAFDVRMTGPIVRVVAEAAESLA